MKRSTIKGLLNFGILVVTVGLIIKIIKVHMRAAAIIVRKRAKIRNQYNQAPHLTQDTKVIVWLCVYTGDNPLAKARGLPSCSYAHTIQ